MVYGDVSLQQNMFTFQRNNQTLFFDEHDSHSDNCVIITLRGKYIQPFVLKTGDYGNDQPNNNITNGKAKYLYKKDKDNWHQKFFTI